MNNLRRFPIIGGPSIPWEAIAPHDAQAKINHDQTLERLAERGGLSPAEAWFILKDKKWNLDDNFMVAETQGRELLHEINQQYTQHVQHLKHVQRFLLSMYQTMVDPVEEFQGNIEQLCELLLKRAVEDRQALHDFDAEKHRASLEFRCMTERITELENGMKTGIRTCTEANVRRVRAEQALLKIGIHHNSTEMWSQCRLCNAVSTLDGKTMMEMLTHKPDCILCDVRGHE